jgi:ATP-binding cassette subfamily F protein 3
MDECSWISYQFRVEKISSNREIICIENKKIHINFRHLPVIAEALNEYQGAMIIVSHDDAFVDKLEGLEEINLEKVRG